MKRTGNPTFSGAGAQRGAAILLMVGILAIGASAWLVKAVGTAAQNRTALHRAHNAQVLTEAKQALIGWATRQALQATEDNPGRLPCPEAGGYIGTPNEGIAAGNCSLPAIGRLPWRTLGLSKLTDAHSEPLWYVVSPGWALPTVVSTLTINSNSIGQLKVDSVADSAVALIIAPGGAINAQSVSAGGETLCTARIQVRDPSAVDYRDYVECQKVTLTDASINFATVQAADAFNDQVLRVRTSDVLPAIEAAIAKRIERDIVPALKLVYANTSLGTSTTNPVFPFAAPFANPGTSGFQGQPGLYQGLLPFNYHSSNCPGGDPRCSSDTISWGTPVLSSSGGPGYLRSAPSCSGGVTSSSCDGYYYGGSLTVSIIDPANNITIGLRTVDVSSHSGTVQAWRWTGSSWIYLGSQAAIVSRNLASNSAVNFVAGAALPSVPAWGYYSITAMRPNSASFADHALLNSAAAGTGWFVRNEWYKLLYYALAPNHAAGGSLSCEEATPTCLTVTNVAPTSKQRAILVLAGRSLTNAARPNANLADFLDTAENRDLDQTYEQNPVGSTFNDRVIVIDQNS